MHGLEVGLTLAGHFRLIRPAGRGGMSEVWLADDTAAGERVALKILAPELAQSPRFVELLRAECVRARRLVHPNIVRVRDFHTDDGYAFVAMQAIEGSSLGALRGAGFRAVARALLPVADALEYAHREGVVHRDLKSSNVLVDAAGHCWLTDFGVAGALAGQSDGAGAGSLPGMSPQQLDGAAPSVSDDVYGFGALLYDLLAGQPLFHPDPGAERIRSETPVLPTADLAGGPLPTALTRLLAALLQKNAAQRPAGMGAVRAALEEILADYPEPGTTATTAAVIRPVERSRAGGVATTAGPAVIPVPRRRGGMPAWLVYGGLGVLAVITLVVMFYLPALVRDRAASAPVRPPAPEPPAAAAASKDSAALEVQKQLFEETLGEFLRHEDELRKVGIERWGGADWTELRRLAEAGDGAYRIRDYAQALVDYRQALDLAKKLRARVPEVLAQALHAGDAALGAGQQAEAVKQFEIALAVDPGNAAASRGLDRAKNLDQVLALVARASAAEAAGQADEALSLYRQAATLDPLWAPAAEAVRRLGQAAARNAYETQMARGYAALAGKNLAEAGEAFQAALNVRPGDADAKSALAQLDAEQRLGRVLDLETQARAYAAQERWADAVRTYEAALAVDPNLQPAQQGLARSRGRLNLSERLDKAMGNADRLNDPAVYRDAETLLKEARAVPDAGPALGAQVRDLERLLQVAATPVRVTFESDNLTEVVVFKVGRLGAFATRTLELRPGLYTAVGTRQGYRDVRRNFRVAADGATPPVVVRCEEPI